MPSLLKDPSESGDLRTDDLPKGSPIFDPGAIGTSRLPVTVEQEPLVSALTFDGRVTYFDAYLALGVFGPRPPLLRRGVVDRLRNVVTCLPHSDLGVALLDTWRTFEEQQALIDFYARFGPTEGFVAAVNQSGPRPPHTTGGAVDLTLTWKGIPLALGSDFDDFTPRANLLACEEDDSLVRRLRRVLATSMSAAGFVGYRLEWWHWSFGEDFWSCATGHPPIYEIIDSLGDRKGNSREDLPGLRSLTDGEVSD